MKQCEYISRTPVFVKSIGGMAIDRSEWENESGAFLCYRENPCRYVADAGHRHCPRHKMETAMRRITMTSRTPRRGNDEKHSRQSGDWRSRGGRVIRLFTLKRWIDAYATWREYEEAKLALLNIHHHKNCPGSPGPILHDDEPRSCFRGGAEPACSRWYQWNRIEFLHQKAVKLAGGGAAKRRGLKT